MNLSHADSHYHVHVFPVAIGAFCRAVKAEGITRTRQQRHVVMPRTGILPRVHGGRLYRQLAVAAYMRLLHGAAFRHLKSPDFQLALSPSDRRNPSRLGPAWRSAFESLPPGSYEAVFHPAVHGDELRGVDKLGDRREIELHLMTDPVIRAAIEGHGVDLITYQNL